MFQRRGICGFDRDDNDNKSTPSSPRIAMGRFSVLVLIVVVVVAQADEQCDDCNKQTWINGADSDPHVAVRLPVRWRAASHYGSK